MNLTSKDITLDLLSSGLMLLIALSFILFWKKKTKASLQFVGIGCVVWLASVLIKSVIGNYLNQPVLNYFKSASGYTGYILIGSIWLGLLTGATEVTFGYLFAKRKKYESFEQGSGYGIGFGAIETGLMALSIAGLVIMEMVSPGNVPQGVITAIQNASWTDVGVVVSERLSAFSIHIAAGVLIVFSLASKKIFYFWIAFAFKSTIDEVVGALNLTGATASLNPWVIEAIKLPFALFGLWIIIKLYKNWPTRDYDAESPITK